MEIRIVMFEIFSYQFMINAFIVGILISISASLLSPFLVLKGQSMIADGLSHTSFLGFVIGILLINQPIWIAILITVIASLLIRLLIEKTNISPDSAVAVISAATFSIGLILISLFDGFNISIEAVMVGSILTSTLTEILISLVLMILIIIFVLVFYRSLYKITYDDEYVKMSKTKYRLLNYILYLLTAILIVIGVKSVGALLVSSLIIFPTLISTQYKLSFSKTIILGIIVSIITMFIGIYSSYYLDIPTGSTIVIINLLVLIVSFIYKKVRKI